MLLIRRGQQVRCTVLNFIGHFRFQGPTTTQMMAQFTWANLVRLLRWMTTQPFLTAIFIWLCSASSSAGSGSALTSAKISSQADSSYRNHWVSRDPRKAVHTQRSKRLGLKWDWWRSRKTLTSSFGRSKRPNKSLFGLTSNKLKPQAAQTMMKALWHVQPTSTDARSTKGLSAHYSLTLLKASKSRSAFWLRSLSSLKNFGKE